MHLYGESLPCLIVQGVDFVVAVNAVSHAPTPLFDPPDQSSGVPLSAKHHAVWSSIRPVGLFEVECRLNSHNQTLGCLCVVRRLLIRRCVGHTRHVAFVRFQSRCVVLR